MAGSRLSLTIKYGRELRDLYQMTAVRLAELDFIDPALCERASKAVAAAVNAGAVGFVQVDPLTRTVCVDIDGLTSAIGGAFTDAGVQPAFLKPLIRYECGWFRHIGWRLSGPSDPSQANSGWNPTHILVDEFGVAG
ncbi:hypothetical protein ABZR86_02475 [Dyella marensis]|uniref:Uncharacterized protein n=1 Tax=Dyella marensis TaxID=500610 RepID=A0A1I2A098_9GAMM|nr:MULTISPECIES: hypothetical protein [Dyella]SFE37392.1 hypothetical protein SAMN02799615_00879 [Dyella marensis]